MYKIYRMPTPQGEQVCILRAIDNAHISSDENHYQNIEYQEWLAEGNEPEEWTGE